MIEVKCKCDIIICEENIDYNNRCNEEGEDYYEGEASCECGKEYEWSEWGECENMEECIDDLIDHIKDEV